ncbi:MAG: Na+/H+ antiporter NhaA [Bacteroidales bacterium]|nr:Na+/H+ antiporter NhaA [Lentimicrobiaceae bacterium]MBQ2852804.1 Na+/H+ antiporter NhaA [Bacteroidales bacterium]
MGRMRLMSKPWISGVLLMTCVVIAMLLANLPSTKHLYHAFLETSLSINISNSDGLNWVFPKEMTVEKFINDILMVVFFFTVGLEIKREVVCGELSSMKKAMLPVIAALGGMLMPALIYILINGGTSASSGWGIPTATDIAFAVGIMSILGDRVPVSLKIFLTALAIADDLGAILVVAFFYGGTIQLTLLIISLLIIGLVFLLNKAGEKRMIYYIIPAIAIWFLFYYAGIHATMSGVVMAMMIPMDARYSRSYFNKKTDHYQDLIIKHENEGEFPNENQRTCLRNISHVSNGAVGMSYRLEHALNPWVNFLIMPIFAIANAGVEIPGLEYLNFFKYSPELGSVGLGIFFGLLLGKPIGITLASWIAIKLKVGEMPNGASWKMLFAVACLGGIGFTMSIFVDTLSFGELAPEITLQLRNLGKIAILAASLSAGILGSLLITLFSKKQEC